MIVLVQNTCKCIVEAIDINRIKVVENIQHGKPSRLVIVDALVGKLVKERKHFNATDLQSCHSCSSSVLHRIRTNCKLDFCNRDPYSLGPSEQEKVKVVETVHEGDHLSTGYSCTS